MPAAPADVFGVRLAILAAGAMISVAIVAAAFMVSLEEVCSRNPDKEQARFNRLIADGELSREDMALNTEPIFDCEWRWR